MKALRQLFAIVAISLSAAGTTFLIQGPPVRKLVCDPVSLKPGELCLWEARNEVPTLWVDARLRKDWEVNGMPNSILWNLDPAEDMQAFESAAMTRIVELPRVVVYCDDENCGLSHQIADRIRALDIGAEVYVLHGGWRALREAGLVRDSNPKS